MEPTKAKVPSEAIELYNLFIHGVISRRAFLDGLQRFAVAGATAATVMASLMPDYARARQVPKDDERLQASYLSLPSPQGHGSSKAYFVRPFSADPHTDP